MPMIPAINCSKILRIATVSSAVELLLTAMRSEYLIVTQKKECGEQPYAQPTVKVVPKQDRLAQKVMLRVCEFFRE